MVNLKKNSAIDLRLQGKSYREIESELGVARSTLNSWLKSIKLTNQQQITLQTRWRNGLIKARKLASAEHSRARLANEGIALIYAHEFIGNHKFTKRELELFLAGLYLGDGFKIIGRLGLGNSNPDIVLLFLTLIRELYEIDENRLRVAIYARADQNEGRLRQYWSELLKIPESQFHKTQFDKRTIGVATKKNYWGVCAVQYCDTSLQRRILAIGREMLKYR